MSTTQQDVADRANVSRALVSLVMRDAPNVSDEKREKVLRAAEELGYRPNAFARSLASKRLHTVGVLVNDVTNPYFGALFASLSTSAREAGYDVLTAPGIRDAGEEPRLVSTLLEHQVAGVVLLSPLMSVAALRRVASTHPTVVVGREVTIGGVDVVTTDETQAAELVVGHLHERGHRRIAHLSGGGNRAARDREKAYGAAMVARGLEPLVVAGSFVQEGGRAAMTRLLEAGDLPTAVIAANDLNAVGAIGALRSAGLRVPEDVSVVGYDDSQVAQLDVVRLTSVRQAIGDFGATAIGTLLERIEDPDRPRTTARLPGTLVERCTVATIS